MNLDGMAEVEIDAAKGEVIYLACRFKSLKNSVTLTYIRSLLNTSNAFALRKV